MDRHYDFSIVLTPDGVASVDASSFARAPDRRVVAHRHLSVIKLGCIISAVICMWWTWTSRHSNCYGHLGRNRLPSHGVMYRPTWPTSGKEHVGTVAPRPAVEGRENVL
jgi:hypothetical protein